MTPYLPETEIAVGGRTLLHAMYDRGCEVRTFMPRYGSINERRNQLHEVIRLSGMNLIIGQNDHQLIIKVASIPSIRAQVYFIDNDDYFSRKATVADANGTPFEDNDERAIFFARGVLETVKKLRWRPDVIHCHGWFSAIVPVYLRSSFADDPMLKDVKIVMSLFDNGFEGELNGSLRTKIEAEKASCGDMSLLDAPTYYNFMQYVVGALDGVVVEQAEMGDALAEIVRSSGKKSLWRCDHGEEDYWDNYKKFYEEL
jgi:starch synthase